jgi:hypothetical protein
MDYTTRKIGSCEITIGPSWVVTHFPGGAELHAHANYDDESRLQADKLGYGSGDEGVEAMTRDHDVFHSLLAEARGLPYSPTLFGVATNDPVDPEYAHEEECIVFLMQRLANGG